MRMHAGVTCNEKDQVPSGILYLLFCLSVDQRIMATIRLPSDTLLTVLSYLSWTDISKFATNILFGSFQSILCSDSLLFLLNQRDLYCSSLQTLPPLSIPMQIYIYSQIIARLQPYSCSQFAMSCHPHSNEQRSVIFCFEELIRMFVEDQCDKHGYLSLQLSDAMNSAFTQSKSVRIGITKTILSHPQCVLWYFYRTDAAGEYGHEMHRDLDYHEGLRTSGAVLVLNHFARESNLHFVKNWKSQVQC